MSVTSRRTVILGGELRVRTILNRHGRPRPEWSALGITAAAGAVMGLVVGTSTGYSLLGFIVAAFGIGAPVLFFRPRPSMAGASPATRMVKRWKSRSRRHSGLLVFAPGEPARRGCNPGGKVVSKARLVPDWIGDVRRVPVWIDDEREPVMVLIQRGLGRTGMWFATVVLEVATGAGGSDAEFAGFGRFKAALARDDSLVGGIQQVEWVGPASLKLHHQWLNGRTRALKAEHERLMSEADVLVGSGDGTTVPIGVVPVPQLVIDSYTELLDVAGRIGEQHRSLLVLRVPFTAAFNQRVIESYGMVDMASRAKTVVLETQRAVTLAMAHGGYKSAEPLGEHRLAAMIRIIQDPGADPEAKGLDLQSCWLPYDGRSRKHVVTTGVDGQPVFRRTARIESVSLPARQMAVDRITALVIGVYPAVTRTLSVVEELIPAYVARQRALEDQTIDRAHTKKTQGRVTDGSEIDQMSASQQRLADLRSGQGHQGVGFAFYISVTATSEVGLTQAVQRMESAANEFTQLTWMDEEHDLAQGAVMPLGRGVAMAPKK